MQQAAGDAAARASQRTRILLPLILTLLVCCLPSAAPGAEPKCLDPSVAASDAAAIRALRTNWIEPNCPCAAYDGTDGRTRRDYVRCVKRQILLAVPEWLRGKCQGRVLAHYKKSTCGEAAGVQKAACLKTSATGKVGCRIDTADKCATALCAPSFTHCIDAGDSNGDLLIDAGDDGTCGCAAALPDALSDPLNCGRCGRQCLAPAGGTVACSAGGCVASCPPGELPCGAGIDGGGRCFAGACFHDVCPAIAGSRAGVVGITGFDDGTRVTQIQAQCGVASIATGADPTTGAVIFAPAPPLPARGPGGGSAWSALCPANHLVVGLETQSAGTELTELTLQCAPVLIDADLALTLGPTTSVGPVGPGGAAGTPPHAETCSGMAPGAVAVGNVGEVGAGGGGTAGLGSVGLVCGQVPPKTKSSSGGCQLDPRAPADGIFPITLLALVWGAVRRLRQRG